MPPIIMYRERTARSIRTRLSRAQFNELEVSIPTRSLADCITIMSELEFSVHTAFWRWKSRNRAGRPRIDRELRELIRRMSMENSLWGASRIHGELLKLGYEVAQSTVSKYMARGGKPPSQSWKTFLRNHAEAIAAIDMCIVPTLSFE